MTMIIVIMGKIKNLGVGGVKQSRKRSEIGGNRTERTRPSMWREHLYEYIEC